MRSTIAISTLSIFCINAFKMTLISRKRHFKPSEIRHKQFIIRHSEGNTAHLLLRAVVNGALPSFREEQDKEEEVTRGAKLEFRGQPG